MAKIEENHLENILRIMKHDDYDEEIMSRLMMYVASRNLIPNYYSPMKPMEKIKEEIDAFLERIPQLDDEENPTD